MASAKKVGRTAVCEHLMILSGFVLRTKTYDTFLFAYFSMYLGYDGVDDYLQQLVEVVMERIGANPNPKPVVNGVNGHSNGLSDTHPLHNGV